MNIRHVSTYPFPSCRAGPEMLRKLTRLSWHGIGRIGLGRQSRSIVGRFLGSLHRHPLKVPRLVHELHDEHMHLKPLSLDRVDFPAIPTADRSLDVGIAERFQNSSAQDVKPCQWRSAMRACVKLMGLLAFGDLSFD